MTKLQFELLKKASGTDSPGFTRRPGYLGRFVEHTDRISIPRRSKKVVTAYELVFFGYFKEISASHYSQDYEQLAAPTILDEAFKKRFSTLLFQITPAGREKLDKYEKRRY